MDKQMLSATELSKFEYCPYQWYYEKIYGRNELRRLKKERNDELGIDSHSTSRLEEGVLYHKKLFRKMNIVRRVIIPTCIIVIVLCAYLFIKGGTPV